MLGAQVLQVPFHLSFVFPFLPLLSFTPSPGQTFTSLAGEGDEREGRKGLCWAYLPAAPGPMASAQGREEEAEARPSGASERLGPKTLRT